MTKNVFIVDDDELFSTMLSDHLSKNKRLHINVFATGEACLEEVETTPEIVVLDYHLNAAEPNAADGLSILGQLKNEYPHCHVIMLSSQSSYGVAATTIAKGAEHYIIKDEEAFVNIWNIIEDYLKLSA